MPRLPAVLLAASALAACATTGQGSNAQSNTDAVNGEQPQQQQAEARAQPNRPARVDRHARAAVEREDLLTQMAFWAAEYQTFPNDLEAAQKFSEVLRKSGRADRASTVADEALNRFPNDPALLGTLGLSQIAAGHPGEAVRPLATLVQAQPQNWRAHSALGVALDQMGRFVDARHAYQAALALQPDNAGILTNLGMSHLLAGEPADAEPILRQASALPNAPPQARQNLAIALALQGKFDEAERIERVDLPPAMVDENMQYLRGLLADPRRWGDMRHG